MIYAENILICIAVPLLVSVVFLSGSAKRFVTAFLTGMAVCLVGAYIGGFLTLTTNMPDTDAAIFLSPVIEEIMKLLPVLFFLTIFVPENRYLMLFSIGIGAGYATFENCCYILSSGADSS